MLKSMTCVALLGSAAIATAQPALASADSQQRLSFRELEYEQPRDPLTGSNPAWVEVHHSPQYQVAPALVALSQAVPEGSSQANAEATLRRAGAHCTPAAGSSQTCTYRDVETVDEYMDDVLWKVSLTYSGDKLASMMVDRSWQRH